MASGDDRFRQWMSQHVGMLQRIARVFADPADQHDLLQELMITVWRAAPSFRGDSSPSTFIWRVAHNRALTWRRREAGRRSRTDAAHRQWMQAAPATDDAEAALLDRLYAAIRELGAVDRSIVLLSLEGVAYREIGALHAMTETAVGARLTRARQKITALVEGDDDGL